MNQVTGVGKDEPTVVNERGGKQSRVHYRFDLLDPQAMFEMTKVLKEGADKYGADNWRNIPVEDHLNHLIIHAYAYLAGDKSDEHLSHIMCRAMFAQGVDIDNNRKTHYDTDGPGVDSDKMVVDGVARKTDYNIKQYVFEDLDDATEVLTKLKECADRYGFVSVADFLDLIKTPCNFTDNSYGWRHDAISTARIVSVRGGYEIKFPPVEML